ncbi:hypothetical protein LJR039_007401 [Pseudorhodoferax sp. LjRoot39]
MVWLLHTVAKGLIHFRFHMSGSPASVASVRHLSQAPSSSGQPGLQAEEVIVAKSDRSKCVAADRASMLTVLASMENH